MSGIPVHSFKAGGRYHVIDAWDVTIETIAASRRFFVGDEGNDQQPLEGYGILNFLTGYICGSASSA